ncbi:uncharacterized protein LOC110024770 [Phalaenopsis equestris]|uniref:uncharacterized protein LOC110024770 n=1 Tax=Phalaenopsis equestris TaxID=78828 RepID=UPI0009E61298|nr:uncharacterized protein LOC110024770 [Phalaenopsis equestris]
MEWRKSYMDLVLVPLSLLLFIVYHGWLWHKVRTQPRRTIIGMNSAGRRLWVRSVMKDSDKKNVLAVQTLRNAIMSSTLMATTCILLCSALAAVLSSTYSVKKPISDSIYGAHGELMVALKYISLLLIFLFAFICYSLSVRFMCQVSFLINTTPVSSENLTLVIITPEYVCELLEKGFLLNTFGNRLFYTALSLLLWVFGPVLVFVCSAVMVSVLYCLDVVCDVKGNGGGEKGEEYL